MRLPRCRRSQPVGHRRALGHVAQGLRAKIQRVPLENDLTAVAAQSPPLARLVEIAVDERPELVT